MPGIQGLKKYRRPRVEVEAEDFIAGASRRSANAKKQEQGGHQAYRRYTFSLTRVVSDYIDRLTFTPNDFRINRSQVVKAGIEALKKLPKKELIELLKQVK